MLNFLPDLHEGHAPITLQQLFGDALEALETWEDERAEPAVIYEDRRTLQHRALTFRQARGSRARLSLPCVLQDIHP